MTEPIALPGRGIKPLASLRAHPWLAAGAALVVLAAGIPFAWIKGQPTYMTEAVIQVAPRYMKNLREDQELEFQSNTQYRQFVQHTMRSVTRFDVLGDALASLPSPELWRADDETERHAIERLREKLVVAAVPDTYLVRLQLAGKRKEGLAEVVNAVTQTFLVRMKNEEIYGSDERARQLLEREKGLISEIAGKAGQRSLIARELSLTTFNEGTPNPYDALVAGVRSRVAEARQRRFDAEAALQAFQTHADTSITLRSVGDAVLNDPGLNSLKAALYKRRAELLIQISGLKADHPVRIAAQREFDEIEQEIGNQSNALGGNVKASLQTRLAGTADQARHVEQLLGGELEALEAQATHFAGVFQDAMRLTAELNQSRQELEKVRERLNYLTVESKSLGFLRMVSPALPAETPVGPGRKKLLLLVLVAAAGLALLAPTLRDLLDRRLLTVNDFERLMGLPPAGWQIERSDASSEIFAREQLRRMATSLIRARDDAQRQVFGFTGVQSGVGTTTLVLDLADTLSELGYSVIAVEANGFARDARYVGSAGPRPGLIEYLHGEVDAEALLGERSPATAVRVPVGGSGREQLNRLDRFKLLLQSWSASEDFVLVDMPPLLVAADAELLTRSVGNTLLVAQAGRTLKGELLRAKRVLQKLDPDSVGLIVNRIAPFQNTGYLRGQMLEAVAGRDAGRFFTMPEWKLRWQLFLLRRRRSDLPESTELGGD